MKSRDLHVVTAIANPMRYASRYELYERWAVHMLRSGVTLTVVELRYGERPAALPAINRRVEQLVAAQGYHFPSIRVVELQTRDILWSKENLINIGIGSLPRDAECIAWIDADVFFQRTGWAKKVLHQLQLSDWIQPWSHAVDMGPQGDVVGKIATSFMCAWANGIKSISGRYETVDHHPGYAWACRRDAYERMGGLIDTAILGAGDRHMCMGLVGLADRSYPPQLGGKTLTRAYLNVVLAWQERAQRYISRNVGYVPGMIQHGWHGPKERRGYTSRWKILVQHQFDPNTDLIRDWSQRGLIGWAHDASPRMRGLQRDIAAYFRSRDEDSTSRG